jgi:PAS domain S-box-containing protein
MVDQAFSNVARRYRGSMMRTSPLLHDIGIALLASALGAVASRWLSPMLGNAALHVALLAAVVLVAWFLGFRAALLTVALEGIFLGSALLPRGAARYLLDGQGWMNLGLFLAVGLAIVFVIEVLHAARRRLEVSARAARSNQRELDRVSQVTTDLSAIVESSEDAVIGKDLQGIITSWNAGAERLYGYTAAEMIGRSISTLIPAEHADELPSIMERLRRGERVEHFDATRIRKDGRRVAVSLSISPIHDADGRVIGASAIARDISDRKQAERFRNARLTIAQVLAQGESLEQVAPLILQSVCKCLDWNLGGLWRVDADHGVLRHVDFWKEPGREFAEFQAVSRGRTFTPGVGLPGRVWERRAPAWIPDVVKDDNFPRAAVADREGLHGAMAYPVAVGGDVLAVMEFFSSRIQEPDGEILELLEIIASQLGLFIERRSAEAELRDAEARIRSVVNHVIDGIITIDSQGIVQTFNAAAERLFGYQAGEVIGRNVSMLMPEPYRGEHDGYLENYLRTGEAKIIGIGREVAGRRKDGSVFPMDLAVSEFQHGGRRLFTGIVRDITERKRLEQELRQRVQELAEGDRRKNEFLATLSHELRNPLAPIRNALEVMQLADGDPAKLAQAQLVMERQLEQMVRLVDDLLDVSRITWGRVELRKQRVELRSVMQGAIEISRPLVTTAGHELVVRIPDESIVVEADPMRLAQVFANLLNNAVKYTEPGGKIWLTAERQGTEVVVVVKDTGIGIPEEALPKVFDMFTQIATQDRSRGGLGIGLALVHRLVAMHGGIVEAHSEGSGKGSEFVVRFPMPAAVGAVERAVGDGAAKSVRARTSGPARRILVVDDNRDSADSLAMLLEMHGHTTHTAYDGLAAVEAFGVFDPEVILLDIGMPRLNGLEAAQQIRLKPRGPDVVLVAMTGWGQDEDKVRAREAGFDHYLTKPVAPQDLQKLLTGLSEQPA